MLHPLVDKFLRKLNKKLEQRMRDRLRKLKDEPFRYLEHLEGQDYYKL